MWSRRGFGCVRYRRGRNVIPLSKKKPDIQVHQSPNCVHCILTHYRSGVPMNQQTWPPPSNLFLPLTVAPYFWWDHEIGIDSYPQILLLISFFGTCLADAVERMADGSWPMLEQKGWNRGRFGDLTSQPMEQNWWWQITSASYRVEFESCMSHLF